MMQGGCSSNGCTADEADAYRRDGFLVRRDLFTSAEISQLAADCERLLQDEERRIDAKNLRCRFMPHHASGQQMFEVFDPVNDISVVCDALCRDHRILSLLDSLYDGPAALFKEKLIFKPAGARGYDIHQDIPLAWEGFPRTFLTVLIAIDACDRENGCTYVYRGYHHDFLSRDPGVYMLPPESVDESRRVDLILNPGDVAVFHGLTPHGSAPNRSRGMRRAFFVSYNALADGGDQRSAHYAEFQQRMRGRWPEAERSSLFFK